MKFSTQKGGGWWVHFQLTVFFTLSSTPHLVIREKDFFQKWVLMCWNLEKQRRGRVNWPQVDNSTKYILFLFEFFPKNKYQNLILSINIDKRLWEPSSIWPPEWQITYLWPGLLGWGEWVRHVITNEFPPFIWLKHFLKILNNVVISSLTFSFNEKSLGSDGGYENGKYYVLQHDNFSVHLTVTRAVAMKMCFGKF